MNSVNDFDRRMCGCPIIHEVIQRPAKVLVSALGGVKF